MTVINVWQGIPSSTELPVVAKIDGSAARLAVWDNEELSGTATFYDPVAGPSAEDIVRFVADDLEPATAYWWQVEVDTVIDTTYTGRARTLPVPGTAFSFTLGAASCASGVGSDGTPVGPTLTDRISNGPVFDDIREFGPLFFVHLGDMHYYDLGSGNHGLPSGIDGASLANYRRAYDDVLLQPRQHELYQRVPIAYVWDDHDYGPNNSDGTFVGKANAQQAHRERVPLLDGDLPGSDGQIFRSRQVGRVLCVLADTRSDRSPNSDPDNSSKTMLGSEQKTWLRGLLESSAAEFFVWFMPSQWIGRDRDDTWDTFTVERAELVEMFTDTGWINRMCIVGGDMHDLAIDTGGNSVGGVPVFQFASLDSDFGSPKPGYDTGPTQPGRNQWGTIEIVDDGQQIRVTGSGWISSSLWASRSFTVGEAAPPEPTDPDGLPQVAQARITTRLTWLSCNLADGALIEELPDLEGEEVSRVIGEYRSANLSLPIPALAKQGGSSDELSLTQKAAMAAKVTRPARTMIVAVVNDIPTWAGIPLTRALGTDANVEMGCVSLEGYLRHRYVRDHLWEGVDPGEIVRGVLADAEDIDGNGQGLNLIVDAPDVGLNAGRYFQATDDETVYGALSELMDAGLIEWTIDVDWRDGFAHRIVDKIARVRHRLGRAGEPQTVFQSATFSSQGGSSASYLSKGEYGGKSYGNWIIGRGTGEGEDQPRSAAAIDQAALDSGAPIWEQRIQPDIYRSPLFTEEQFNEYIQEQLGLHVTEELARIRDGSHALHITARWDAPGARYGVDWQLGDDVRHELKGHAHPGGLNGTGRAIGFALSIRRGTIRPILQEDDA